MEPGSGMTASEFIAQRKNFPSIYDQFRAQLPKPTIYLSGPMTGIPEYNYPEFRRYAEKYRAEGFTVVSPHEMDEADGSAPGPDGALKMPYTEYLRRDVAKLAQPGIDRMYLMPGWQKSRGANLEKHVAESIGIALYDAETGKPYEESAMQEAHRLVYGDRGDQYGHPLDDHGRTAGMLTHLLSDKLKFKLNARDVSMIMTCVKLSRERNKPKRDNRVDAAGYCETLDRSMTEAERRGIDLMKLEPLDGTS